MADLHFTLYAAASDRDVLIEALRKASHAAIHSRPETVHGRDFGDARTAERVTGTLDRVAIELVCADDAIDALIGAVRDCKRRYPVRWFTTSIHASGRIE